MSGWLGALIAVALPLVVVWLVLERVLGRPPDRWAMAERIGMAYPIAVLGVGSLLWAAGEYPLAAMRAILFPVLLALALLGGVLRWMKPPTAVAPAGPIGDRHWLAGALVIMLVAGLLIAVQALLQPTLAWDAWNAWLAKPKAWFHAGEVRPVMEFSEWVMQPSGSAIAVIAAKYPEALPRFATWVAVLAGSWRDAYVHLLWPLLWASLGLITAGLLRRFGARPQVAAVASAFLLTLPLVGAHASLPGYADLWLATLLLMAVGNASLHLLRRDRGSLLLAVAAILLLPVVKLEGAVYAAILVGSYVFWRLPAVARKGVLLMAALVLLVVAPVWGLKIPLPGLGLLVFDDGVLTVPLIGTLALSWRPVAGPVLESLFQLPNWSLLWYLALPIMALHWRRMGEPGLAMAGTFLAGTAAFHFVLFFFTDASAWAESLTSLNRLVLHAVPVWVVWLALLVNRPQPPRGRYA